MTSSFSRERQVSEVAFVHDDLKWKTGPIEEPLPFSVECKTYEELRKSSSLKEYLLNHIFDDYFISKLIADNADNTEYRGILHHYTKDEKEKLQSLFNNMNNCAIAGIKVSSAINLLLSPGDC